jgi:hypothetical protein
MRQPTRDHILAQRVHSARMHNARLQQAWLTAGPSSCCVGCHSQSPTLCTLPPLQQAHMNASSQNGTKPTNAYPVLLHPALSRALVRHM